MKPSDTKKDTSKSEGDLGASERTTSKQGEKPAHEGVSEKAHEMKNDDDKAEKGHEKSKKVGFMEKMKGEAKMLFGKVEGGKKGEEKVEEGKRIKSGEAHAASSTKA